MSAVDAKLAKRCPHGRAGDVGGRQQVPRTLEGRTGNVCRTPKTSSPGHGADGAGCRALAALDYSDQHVVDQTGSSQKAV